jgi:transposase-like protein
LGYSLSYRDLEELMAERGLSVDHCTVARWVLRYSPELSRRIRRHVIEQDHRFIKKRIVASLWFRSVRGAVNTMAGYESMQRIRKGQVRWLAKGEITASSQ